MPQAYHSNAKTNQHLRKIIQNSDLTNVKLADKYCKVNQHGTQLKKMDIIFPRFLKPLKSQGE